MRLKYFDNYLISIMSAVALACLYMLYGAKHVNFNSKNEIKVASIVEQFKTVKRKRDFYQGWVDVKLGDSLSQNDEIYTHEQSSANIKFTDGPEINLFENSLLRIKSGKLGSTISLEKGNMLAKLSPTSQKLDIELNGKKYSFNSQNADIQIEQGKTENKFLLLSGKAKLADQEILSNQVAILNLKTGDLKIKEIPFIPQLPLNNQTLFYLKEAIVNFSWIYTNQAAAVRITISRDSNFSEIISEESVENNNYMTTLSQAGTYYWKLTSSDLIDGPIKSFSLIEESRPELNSDQAIIYQGPKVNSKFYLNWSINNGKKYLIKIESSDGKLQEVTTTKAQYEFIPKDLGVYSITVKVADDSRPFALWSEPIYVSMKEALPISITSVTPELIEKVNYNEDGSNFLLSWNGPLEGTQYIIKLTKDSKTVVMETEQTSTTLSLKDPGIYNWEVIGTSSAGMVSNQIAGKITINKPSNFGQLTNGVAAIELDKPDQLVTFKWNKIETASLYQFELSNEPSFKKIISTREINTNNISMSLTAIGRYYWRVKVNGDQSVESPSPVSVEVKPAPPLSRPEVSPDIKIKLKYLDETSSTFNLMDLFISKVQAEGVVAVAEWDLPANDRAKSYIVEIYRDAELKELITRIETPVPKVTWKNASAGTFYWRVSFIDFWGRKTEFSNASLLSTEALDIRPVVIEIELQNPKHKADILVEEADQFQLIWKSIPGAQDYQVIIAQDLEFKNIILMKSSLKNEFQISCNMFDGRPGEYFWRITSGENTSKRRQFSITCTPAPAPLTPEVQETKSETIVQEIPIVEEILSNNHFLKLGFSPHQIAYQNKSNQYMAKINGISFNSWYATYQRPIDLWNFKSFSPSFSFSRGKVFNDISFMDMELNLKAKRNQTSFSWGPLLAFMNKTLYVESNLVIKDESVTSPLLGLFIQKEIDLITMNAEIKMGTMINYHAAIEYQMKNNFAIGAFVDSSSITKDNNKHTFSRYGLNLNYTLDFLESIK